MRPLRSICNAKYLEGTVPLVDGYLWVKLPGECDSAGGVRAWDYSTYNPWNISASGQSTFDPLWGQVDPAP
jgi:endoglucanase